MNPSQPEPVAGEQTPESAEVKACPSLGQCCYCGKPIIYAVEKGQHEDGRIFHGNCWRKIDLESSSLASLQQENEKYKDCFNEMRDEAVRLRDERDQLRADVERLTKENEVQSHEIRLISDHRDQLMRERDEARAEADAAISRGSAECSVKQKAWDELERLRVQLAEREEDRKDLDWLEASKAYISAPNLHWRDLRYGPIRAAIRSARGATPEGTPKEGAAGQAKTWLCVVVDPESYDTIFCKDIVEGWKQANYFDPKDADEEDVERFRQFAADEDNWWRDPWGKLAKLRWNVGGESCGTVTFYRIDTAQPLASADCAAPDRGAQEEGKQP